MKNLLRNFRRNIFLVFLTALIITNYNFLFSQGDPVAESLKNHVKALASEEFEGRYAGSEGNRKAADYIAAYFKSIGLAPTSAGYFQMLPFTTGVSLGTSNNVSFSMRIEKPGIPIEQVRPIEKKWNVGEDWYPIALGDNGKFEQLDVVFAGFGMNDEQEQYNDYEGIDCKGKAVIFLTESPWESKITRLTYDYESIKKKIIDARNQGAKAVIIARSQGDSANVFFGLKYDMMFKNSGVPVIQVNRNSLTKLFPRDKQLVSTEQEIIKTKKPRSFVVPNIKVNINVDIKENIAQIPNVIGIVTGNDNAKKDEYVIVGAHFDHLGYGNTSSSLYKGKTPMIHFGADDNASGVSAMMELAARFTAKPARRSIIFMAFNGEEEGLIGSSYYCKSPVIPLNKTIYMMNLDMVGRKSKENKLNIFGIGSSTGFAQLVDSLATVDSIDIVKAKDPYGPSDQSSFYSKGVPIMFLFTGVHGDYHKPSDTWDKLNYDGLGRIAHYSESIVRTIANSDSKPDLLSVGSDTTDRPKMGKGNGAWFGIVPNFEENPKGMLISGTSEGSPALKAGLKSGDIITKFGDKPVKNLYDLTYALQSHKPGDEIEVIYIRGDKETTVKVTLGKK